MKIGENVNIRSPKEKKYMQNKVLIKNFDQILQFFPQVTQNKQQSKIGNNFGKKRISNVILCHRITGFDEKIM